MEPVKETPESGRARPPRTGRPVFGIILIVVGLLLLLDRLVPDLSDLFWPALLIAAGAWLLWRASGR